MKHETAISKQIIATMG